jgi:pimeloyl-ACP methyl ester carboxylesterase
VLPSLSREHDVLALRLPGHMGGPPLPEPPSVDAVLDVLEAALDEAGFADAHLVGNSLGGFLALRLASRGRARSVVALAPAGGWALGDSSWQELLAFQSSLHQLARATVTYVDAIVSTPEGRRRATEYITVRYEHIPASLLAHQVRGVAACDGAPAMIAYAQEHGWSLDASLVRCPVRVVWGTADRLLPWPRAAARFRSDWLPHADWVELDDVGHSPQLDVPLETAQLILGFTAG